MSKLRRFRKNRQLVAGSTIGLVIVLLGVFGPMVFGGYADQDLLLGHKPIGTEGAFFGTDALGRDLAARATFGIRISLLVAIAVTANSRVHRLF